MFKKRFANSLQIKFLVMMYFILAVSGVISGVMVVGNNRKLMEDRLKSRGLSFGNYISGISADYLTARDFMQLDNIIKEINRDIEIVYALIRDTEGNLVTTFFASLNFRSDQVRIAIESLPRASGLEDVISGIKKKNIILEIPTPIVFGDKVAGQVILGMSKERINQQINRIITFIIFANCLAFVVAVILLSTSQMIIIKPIVDLAGLMAVVSRKKDYSIRAKVNRKDEMGELASGFNDMLEQISLRDKELQAYRKSLENEVSKRTAELVNLNNLLQKDLVERKRIEDELRQINNQLKATEAQLIQTSKMAAVGQLAGGVAHEINNPLTGVLNNVQLIWMTLDMKKDFNVDDFKELLKSIEASALRCKKITQSLLDFSHSSKGRFETVSLNEVAREVNDLLQNEFKLQNISIILDLDQASPGVRGDPQLLRQVIFGIMVNAGWAVRKKSKDGGKIIIKTWHENENKNVYLSISDNGVGISPDNISKLFEPFFTTKDIGEGTGLGLALAYSIIKSHQGDIKISSELGAGTVFTLILPVENING